MLPIIFRGHKDAGFFVHALAHNNGRRLINSLPNNQRTSEARYACIVPVLDYWRMSKSIARANGAWHYSECIEEEIITDIQAGRAILVFDLSNEGPAYWTAVFDELYQWIEEKHLPSGRVVWLSQNRAIVKSMPNDAVNSRANLIRFEFYDFNTKMMSWKFSPQSKIVNRDPVYNHDPDVAISRLLDISLKDRFLLCLNGTPRLNRIITVAALSHYHLINNSLVSFGGFKYVKPGNTLDDALRFVDKNPRLKYLDFDISSLSSRGEMLVDQFNEKGNDLVFKIDVKCYERTFFSLVTESDFSDGDILRITEKTVKAFCLGHPTFIIGNPNSIAFLTEIGFKDWDTSIDRAGDSILNPADRFAHIFRAVLGHVEAIRENPKMWIDRTRDVTEFNIHHAFDGGMLERYIALFDEPIVSRFRSLIGLSD